MRSSTSPVVKLTMRLRSVGRSQWGPGELGAEWPVEEVKGAMKLARSIMAANPATACNGIARSTTSLRRPLTVSDV